MLNVKRDSYKIGLDEVEGLQDAMTKVLQPIVEHLESSIYWVSDLAFHPTEYKSRDGFMAYESNCGGMELSEIVPKSEEYNFSFLGFGECDECGKENDANGESLQCGYNGQECAGDSEGHFDAKLRIWLKFEGLQDDTMSFYLVLSGGNGDAPYFREKSSQTYFESEFQAKSLTEFKKVAAKHIAKLIKVLK